MYLRKLQPLTQASPSFILPCSRFYIEKTASIQQESFYTARVCNIVSLELGAARVAMAIRVYDSVMCYRIDPVAV